MQKIRMAILGYGRSGSTLHADALEASKDFEIAAVCDIDEKRQEEARKRFGCRIYSDYRQMLQQEKLDMVSVVTRSDQHSRMACDCLETGVNVLVTKPWCLNEEEAGNMIDAAGKSGKLLMPWLPARWGVDYKRLKEIITAGTIGKVFFIRRGVYSFALRNDWQTEKKYGGGYLFNWGYHIIDPPVQLMDAKVSTVYGVMKQVINPGDVEDVFYAVLTLDSGVTVQVEYSMAAKDLPSWFIQGDRGTIVVRGAEIETYTAELQFPKDPTKAYSMKPKPTLVQERVEGELYGDAGEIYAEIAMAVRRERAYPVTLESALAMTRVMDAIRRSSLENRVVAIGQP